MLLCLIQRIWWVSIDSYLFSKCNCKQCIAVCNIDGYHRLEQSTVYIKILKWVMQVRVDYEWENRP